jgi:hypothetical protein
VIHFIAHNSVSNTGPFVSNTGPLNDEEKKGNLGYLG